jgi:hypothetical protein
MGRKSRRNKGGKNETNLMNREEEKAVRYVRARGNEVVIWGRKVT